MQNVLRSWLPLCGRRRLGSRLLLIEGRRRPFSSKSREGDAQKLKVVCGSSGSIDVDLYNAPALQSPSSPLIIYLPPTGVHLRSGHPPIPSYLFHHSAALATINYRWNIPSPTTNSTKSPSPTLSTHPSFKTHAFPTPLHDTLHAYTHLLSLLSSSSQPQTPSSSSSPFSPRPLTFYGQTATKAIQRPILLYGTYLSASLATSLALTETFTSKHLPTRIAGLLVRDGFYEWTSIATSSPPPAPFLSPESGDGGWDSKTLFHLRDKLFSTPDSAFDAFASPVLFFRTAGLGVPKMWPVSSSEPSSSTSPSPSSNPLMLHDEDESTFYPRPDPSLVTDMDIEEFETGRRGRDGGTLELEVSRKANLKFPPRDSGLKIPRSLFLYTSPEASPRTEQEKEGEQAKVGTTQKQARRQARRKVDVHVDLDAQSEEISPRVQAEEMVRLMRRSVQLHEFKERVQWDEDLDPESAAEKRVGISGVGGLKEEETVVRAWIEDILDA
ncbi:hypothetical protein V8E51_002325 [Hyaloscypha variabilis]